ATIPRDTLAAVHDAALIILFNKRLVTSLLDQAGNLVDRVIPRDVLPVIGTRPAHLRFQQATVVQDVLVERRTLRAERAAIDGVVRVALDVNHLRGYVLC